MNRGAGILAATVMALVGCGKEQPTPQKDDQLGIAAIFPGVPTKNRFLEPTPFGSVEWFSYAYRPGSRLDQSFQVDVGNLPPGTEGGGTPEEIVETYHRWLLKRFGKVEREELAPQAGPGFRYQARSPMGTHLLGILVVRRGRLHRAEATVSKQDDPRARIFLESFAVQP
jgi:hypothetical protein